MNEINVLIVEDEVMIALETSEVVKDLGYLVSGIVSSGEEAITLIRNKQPDIILMDINLAGELDGIETADIIHMETTIPVVFLTAHAEDCFLKKAKKTLPYGYLVKPVQERDLKITIEMALYANKVEADRRLAEESLKRSQRQYQDLVESANTIIIKCDPKGQLTFINKYGQDFFGYQEKEIIGKEIIGTLVPEEETSGKHLGNMIRQILKRPDDFAVNENENIRKDGSRIWISWSNKAITDEDGNLIEILSMGHDVTRQKSAQEKVKNRTSMLQVVLDSIQESALLLDPKGNILFANQTVAERMQRSSSQLTGANIGEILSKDLSEARMQAVDEVIKTRRPTVFHEVRGEMNLESFVYPVITPEESILGASILSVDITERIRSEMNLKKLWLAIDQSPISIIITNHEGVVEYTNPGFTANTGYLAEEITGSLPWPLKPKAVEKSFILNIWEEIKSGKDWKGEIQIKKKHGEISWEQTSISPVVDASGDILHFIAIMEDITNKKELENLKEDIQGIMRHDLRTPLTAILGYPPLLLRSNLTDQQEEQVRNIAQSGKRLLKIIDSYLNIYKMETGTYRPSPKPVDLNTVIKQILSELKYLSNSKSLEIVVTMNQIPIEQSETVTVNGDEVLCYSLLENLIKNAMEASPHGEKIQIEITSTQTRNEISIKNQGAVPMAIRDHFFDKYVSHGKSKGTGFGTYSAKLMVEKQGGTIEMQTSEQQGTRVIVTFPAQ